MNRSFRFLLALTVLIWLKTTVVNVAASDDQTKLANSFRLGVQSDKQGDLRTAISHYENASQIAKKILDENDVNLAAIAYRLGKSHYRLKELTGCRDYYEEALKIYRNNKDLRNQYRVLSDIGMLYTKLGMLDKARQFYSDAALIHDRSGDPVSGILPTKINQAYLNIWNSNFQQAKQTIETTLREYQRLNNPVQVALCHYVLGQIATSTNRFDEAVVNHRKALEIREKHLPANHRWLSQSYSHLGQAYLNISQIRSATIYLSKAYHTMESWGGSDYFELSPILELQASIAKEQNDFDLELEKLNQSRRIRDSYVRKVLPYLSESEQVAFMFGTEANSINRALSYALEHQQSPLWKQKSFEWLLNAKGRIHESVTRKYRQIQQRDNGDSLTSRRAKIQEQIASIVHDRVSDKNKLQKLNQELDSLSRQASKSLTSTESWTTVSKIFDKLAQNEVFVNIARVPNFSTGKSRYFAWLLKPDGEISVLDLGDSNAIDSAISSVRSQLKNTASNLSKMGEKEAASTIKLALQNLSAKIFQPIVDDLPNSSNTIVVSPDSAMWLVPWDCLLTTESRFAIEEYEFNLVLTGRELADRNSEIESVNTATIFANPDYYAVQDLSKITETRGASKFLPQVWNQLPGTEIEAKLIERSLKTISGSHGFKKFLGSDANERNFKSIEPADILIFATHGFSLPLQEKANRNMNIDLEFSSMPENYENPLVRCGLVLAGANRQRQSGYDDGILTGLEISGKDLSGTELVVLSACETGLGDLTSGEGIVGLRKAFQLAGAENIIATLWTIDDRSTALLMNNFWKNLADGIPTGKSLRKAKLQLIDERRQRNGAAHPFFWAGFNLSEGHR